LGVYGREGENVWQRNIFIDLKDYIKERIN
jgi:hypothetical protein